MPRPAPKVLATICARGGSKGIPNKNILELHGRPLISYTLECARRCQ
ncbi:MAG: acylneuraminate cytidylyltransferase family protein, partial [Gemmatimonadetes bacterium]|nr:acylneuraminate cytidylyltransferase family protein [Gemmatimonadota bacterium]